MSSFTWQGVDLRPDHRRWRFWIEQGRDELPTVRRTADLIPFRRGRLHRPGIGDTRQLELKGYIQEPTLAAFQATKDMLKGLLDPEMDEPGVLVDPQDDGSERWIYAVPGNLISKLGGEGTRILSIELLALDPFWYRTWGSWTLDEGLFMDDGLYLDEGGQLVISPTSNPFDVTFNALGTAGVTTVRVEIDGPLAGAAAVEVTNRSTPSEVGFEHPAVLADQTLILDSGLRTVDLEGNNARGDLTLLPANRHGEYLRLVPGSNTLRIVGQPAQVRLIFPATYL